MFFTNLSGNNFMRGFSAHIDHVRRNLSIHCCLAKTRNRVNNYAVSVSACGVFSIDDTCGHRVYHLLYYRSHGGFYIKHSMHDPVADCRG